MRLGNVMMGVASLLAPATTAPSARAVIATELVLATASRAATTARHEYYV
jgi:hypothetical protein